MVKIIEVVYQKKKRNKQALCYKYVLTKQIFLQGFLWTIQLAFSIRKRVSFKRGILSVAAALYVSEV